MAEQRGWVVSTMEAVQKISKSNDAVVDLTRLIETADGDFAFEQELIGVFLEDTASRIAGLEALRQKGDMATLRREAHTLKGSCGNVGAAALAAWAMRLEQVCNQGDLSAAGNLFGRLEEEFSKVRVFFEAYLARQTK
jgi:HPt (histidine-containing phosphotransfer) domain-containing protein